MIHRIVMAAIPSRKKHVLSRSRALETRHGHNRYENHWRVADTNTHTWSSIGPKKESLGQWYVQKRDRKTRGGKSFVFFEALVTGTYTHSRAHNTRFFSNILFARHHANSEELSQHPLGHTRLGERKSCFTKTHTKFESSSNERWILNQQPVESTEDRCASE